MKYCASIRFENGAPRLYLNDRRIPPVLFCLSDFPAAKSNTAYAQKNIRQFQQQGILPVCADIDLALSWFKFSPPDFEPIQAEIAGVLDANPDAPVLLRLHVNPPYWWIRDNPEEQVLYIDHFGIDDGERRRMIQDDHRQRIRVSLASEKWLKEAGELVAAMCDYLKETPEGDSLIGLQIACGVNGEWHQWGTDCSVPMRRRFRKMLLEEYGTDEALQRAWGRPDVTIDTAPFQPDPRQLGDDGVFRDPVRSRHIIDAQRCIQLTPPEDILYFCRIIRKHWPGMLTGAFYGYFVGCGGANAPIGGHLNPLTLLDSPDLDYLSGPFPYMKNRLPAGAPISRGLLESNRLHGKLWLTEMDQHPAGSEHESGGDPARRSETLAQMRRNVLLPLLSGEGLWYYDHRIVPSVAKMDAKRTQVGSIWRKKGWWDQPDLMEEIGKLQRLAEENDKKPYTPAADVLCVFDAKAPYQISGQPFSEYPLLHELLRCGVMADFIYLEDFARCEISRYRAVFFCNTWLLTDEQTDMIHRMTAKLQRVWLWAPGYSNGKTLSPDNIARVTGMRVKRIPGESASQVLSGMEEDDPIPFPALDPFFAVDSPEAEALISDHEGRTLAARKGSDWYFARPIPQKEHLQRILAEAGAHIYTEDGAFVIADGAYLYLNTASGGRFTVHLRNGKTTELTLDGNATAVLDAESGSRIL